ncbi:DNA primase [Hwanghaeella grinnelliae]|uniref:DNA primase n=1 Tax=Hwanghaeella grinnelliae TaxID=2500179 RepID=A0A437QMR8_9PROT|nr:DNA primase [Hwanghaeella grinnelliae]RVU35838.1 DNA primase [Hwanghaeella grinnelliae]
MAFPPGFLDEVRARVSLSGLVGRRVQLKQRGRDDWWGLSPFVNEKSPSFHVREDKGFFHCFSSGEHGDHFSWLMKLEGLSFPEAVERLATDAGLDMPERTPEQKAADERRGGLTDATEAACGYFQRALRSEAGREALKYLRDRGLKDETIAAFRLGYAPGDSGGFKDAMTKAGIPEQVLMETGLMRRSDGGRSPYAFFRDRIQFPILDARGRVIAFGGRFMGDAKAAGVGKYVNSPDTVLFDKGRTLYNLQNARQAAHDGQTVLVVEGYMDVIALAEYGLDAAVAPLGTAITEHQLQLLWRFSDEPVLCLDGDDAGLRAALRAAERALPLLKPGKSLRFAFLPAGEDPDTLVRGQGAKAITTQVDTAEPLDLVLWRSEVGNQPVDTPERRAALEDRLKKLAGQIEDESVRREYFRTFNDRAWSAFRQNRGGQGKTGGRGGFRAGGGNGRSANGRPFQQPQSKRIMRLKPGMSRRRQQVLLAALLNHPALLPDFDEDLRLVEFDADLDKLLLALQNITTIGVDLDVEAINHHFAEHGSEQLLRLVRNREVLDLARQARADAPDAEARSLIEHILRLRSQETLQSELETAARGASDEVAEARVVAFHDTFSDGERDLCDGEDDIL